MPVVTLEATLEEERDRSFLDLLSSLAAELGPTFRWGSVYLTIFLIWWKGQTPGKRLPNVRVTQRDGAPPTPRFDARREFNAPASSP